MQITVYICKHYLISIIFCALYANLLGSVFLSFALMSASGKCFTIAVRLPL